MLLLKKAPSITVILSVIYLLGLVWLAFLVTPTTKQKEKKSNQPYPVEKVASALNPSRSLKFFLKKGILNYIYRYKLIHTDTLFMYI